MNIKRGTIEDLDLIVEMGERFANAAKVADKFAYDMKTVKPFVERVLTHDKSQAFIAMNDVGPSGMAIVTLNPVYYSPGQMVCQEICWWVEDGHRNFGVGKSLLKAIEEWAKEKGATMVSMAALAESENEKVTGMYKRAGYRPFETSYLKEVK